MDGFINKKFRANKCHCGTEPIVALTSDNYWLIKCPHCGNVIRDYTDRRCKQVRVVEPRSYLFRQWDSKNDRIRSKQ